MNILSTNNLQIITCNRELLNLALESNAALASHLNVIVPDNWTEFGDRALQYASDKLKSADDAGWWTYFPIHKKDNKLIGSGGYKGRPTNEGTVEIGYEITSEYRNKGLATEFVKALIQNAFLNTQVKAIEAHTLAEDNPSTKVLTKCEFKIIEEINDPDNGLLWKWELRR